MKRPISLLIVAAFFLWGGIRIFLVSHYKPIPSDSVSVAIKIITGLFILFIGIGLLQRVRAARICGLIIIGSAIIGALFFTVWDLSHLGSLVVYFYGVRLDNNPHPPASALLVAFYMFTIIARDVWMFWVLMRRDVRELFQRKSNSPTPAV